MPCFGTRKIFRARLFQEKQVSSSLGSAAGDERNKRTTGALLMYRISVDESQRDGGLALYTTPLIAFTRLESSAASHRARLTIADIDEISVPVCISGTAIF